MQRGYAVHRDSYKADGVLGTKNVLHKTVKHIVLLKINVEGVGTFFYLKRKSALEFVGIFLGNRGALGLAREFGDRRRVARHVFTLVFVGHFGAGCAGESYRDVVIQSRNIGLAGEPQLIPTVGVNGSQSGNTFFRHERNETSGGNRFAVMGDFSRDRSSWLRPAHASGRCEEGQREDEGSEPKRHLTSSNCHARRPAKISDEP